MRIRLRFVLALRFQKLGLMENISSGKAADCSAWAANAAATICGMAFYENQLMTDEAIKLLFKKTWEIKMIASDCGYGSAASCNTQNCPGGQFSADWHNGFFEWIEEQFFGCE